MVQAVPQGKDNDIIKYLYPWEKNRLKLWKNQVHGNKMYIVLMGREPEAQVHKPYKFRSSLQKQGN